MTTTTLERREEYDVGADFVLPDLLDADGDVRLSSEQDRLELVSAYYDTAGLDLLRNGITLRHRRGSIDAGWQLKVPRHAVRLEIGDEQDSASVPKQIRDLLAGVRRGPLKKVAELRISRDVRTLTDDARHVLVTVSHDTVTGVSLAASMPMPGWREIEVEFGAAADAAFSDVVRRRLIAAGAQPVRRRSKLTRALGLQLDAEVKKRRTRGDGASRQQQTAGAIIVGYLAEQYDNLVRGDIALRLRQDAVHDVRVAVRRMRSTLRVFADFLDAESASELETELCWYGRLLGSVRDRDVLLDRLNSAAAALPAGVVSASLARQIHEQISRDRDRSWTMLLDAMNGRRYRHLIDRIATWLAAPRTTSAAQAPAEAILPAVHAAQRLVTRRLRAAHADADSAGLHRARKAAKRARYAVELARPLIGSHNGKEQARHYARLQELLGSYRDAMIAQQFLLDLQPDSPHDGFGCGALYEFEIIRARKALVAVRRAQRH